MDLEDGPGRDLSPFKDVSAGRDHLDPVRRRDRHLNLDKTWVTSRSDPEPSVAGARGPTATGSPWLSNARSRRSPERRGANNKSQPTPDAHTVQRFSRSLQASRDARMSASEEGEEPRDDTLASL